MIKNLVIVESPAKAKTIGKFLGPEYTVTSSMGHIRDLKKRGMSIDTAKGFEPEYEVPADKKAMVTELRRAAKEAEMVWLASDEDREGEAIAWHLYQVLELKPENTRRIVFHEITKPAIERAIAHPREIDLALVDAQQARRVLDRLVGFELSPVLWKKIKPALSAGRVQSVAVRLIMEREEEIKSFRSVPFWRVNGTFATSEGKTLGAELSRRFDAEAQARQYLEEVKGATWEVGSITTRPVSKAPQPPFTTSTLQQEASRRLGFSVSQTMMVAQKLYEEGRITYMRTDSLNLSELAVKAMAAAITDNLGAEYVKLRKYHTSQKGAQEAHEAIRPTDARMTQLKEGTSAEKRLYALIWKRAVASQMADAELEKTTVEIQPSTRAEHLTATGETVRFDGFLRVWLESGFGGESEEESDGGESAEGGDELLPPLRQGQTLTLRRLTATERFTQQPARYTEGSLVKKMEELGIGRPSTYAPTISTIQQREYVEKGEKAGTPRQYTVLTLDDKGSIEAAEHTENVGSEKGKLIPTDIGEVVNKFLVEYFPDILDYNFTAQVEEKFDDIAEGKLPWRKEIGAFYEAFHPEIEKVSNMRLEHKVGERLLGQDPATGKPVSVKIGRFGPMIQLGESQGEEKPQFASLLKGQSVNDITLEDALRLFEFPKKIGEFEDKEVTVAIGRFGPYVKHDGKFVSIPRELSPAELSLEEAAELILAKREADAHRLIKDFGPEEPELQILNGRFGPYICYKKQNYKIPKAVEKPVELTLEECRELIAKQPAKATRARKARKK